MSETSVDGITTQNAGSNNPLSDAWPSAESITELRVDGVSNNAEIGQPGALTSITKSGTNDYHGGLFWYHKTTAITPINSTSGAINILARSGRFSAALAGRT